jgi:Family of unknown function (DUF5762)
MDLGREIFKSDQILVFWPTAKQSSKERMLATTRFIIYATCLVYIINRDPRIFALGILALAILYYLWNSNLIKDSKVRGVLADGRQSGPLRNPVTLPTFDNPMGNVLLTDYADNPDRPSAAWYPSVRTEVQNQWDQIHPFERVRDAERNFYTVAATTIPNDQTAFAEASFGRKFSPMCKDQGGRACDPDNFYFHFPETTQLRAGNGGAGTGGGRGA